MKHELITYLNEKLPLSDKILKGLHWLILSASLLFDPTIRFTGFSYQEAISLNRGESVARVG